MKKIVVTGSLAYDHLMTFDGEFGDSLIADKLASLSVSFLAKTHEHYFGGCAGNIAYNLKLLGCEPLVLGVAGGDFGRYGEWMSECGISTANIFIDKSRGTASAYVLTDKKQRQISIFSPGAMENYENGLELDLPAGQAGGVDIDDIACAIIAPEPPKRMVSFGRYFKRMGVPFIFDPGQAIPALGREEILELMSGAVGMILNEYELEMVRKKLEMGEEELLKSIANGVAGFLIVTMGEKGCRLGDKIIPAVKGVKVVDVTGCGDAFRAGFLSGYVNGLSLAEACVRANAVAARAIEHSGTQNHHFTLADL